MAGRDARWASIRRMPRPEPRLSLLVTSYHLAPSVDPRPQLPVASHDLAPRLEPRLPLLVPSHDLAPSLVVKSRLAWRGVDRRLPGWAFPRRDRPNLNPLGGRQGLPSHACPPAQISQSWTWGGRIRSRPALRRTARPVWAGWRSPLGGGQELRKACGAPGLLRSNPHAILGRDTSVTMSRPSLANSHGVIRDRGPGRPRARGTACRSAGSSCDGRNWRMDLDKNSALVTSDPKFLRQFGCSSGPFPAGCRRRAGTGL